MIFTSENFHVNFFFLPFITGGGFTPVSCNNKPEICDFGCYSAMRLSKIKARGIALYLEKNSFILVDFFLISLCKPLILAIS
jgi:hypothetical protein